MPGCDQCQYTNTPGDNMYVKVGYTSGISNNEQNYV